MEQLYEFARGPLFRFCIALMVLGILRAIGMYIFATAAVLRNGSGIERPVLTALRSVIWVFSARRPEKAGLLFRAASFAFHSGVLIVPVFLHEHAALLGGFLGMRWSALPRSIADVLTVVTIISGALLLVRRAGNRTSRAMSAPQDYCVLLLITVLFLSGYMASSAYNPFSFRATMLVHVLCGDIILAMIPFSKLSHGFLFPVMRVSGAIGWKFPSGMPYDGEEAAAGQAGPSL